MDISKNGTNFEMPYKPPKKVIDGLLVIVANHIKDAAELRDIFRRTKFAEIAENVYMSMFNRQDLKASLVEIEKAEKLEKFKKF